MYMTDKWEGKEHFNIKRFKYIEFYVGNAKQVVHFYRSAFGFTPYAYCGPETGVYSHVSYVLKSRKIFFVFTTPLKSSHPASDWLKKHGDGVRDVAFDVEDVNFVYDSCIERGAIPNVEPHSDKEEGLFFNLFAFPISLFISSNAPSMVDLNIDWSIFEYSGVATGKGIDVFSAIIFSHLASYLI